MIKRIALVVLALAAGALILWQGYRQSVVEAYAREYQEAYHQLDLERTSIVDEMETLEQQRRAKRVCAMGMLLMEKPETRVYSEIYPILEEFGYSAAIALSVTEYPGQPGCISEENFAQLRESGWAVCAAWDGRTPLEELRTLFRNLRLPRPDVVLVDCDRYTVEMDEKLRSAGYKVVIHHGETLPFFQEPDGALLRHLSAIYWNHPQIAAYLESAVENRYLMSLNVDFVSNIGNFDETLFRNMCRFLQQKEDIFPVTNLSAATQIDEREEAFYEARKAYLQQELDRCSQQVERLYEMYEKYNPRSGKGIESNGNAA